MTKMKLDARGAQKRFEKNLGGTWASYLGGGHDMMIGISLTFYSDGTGTMEEHGFDWQYQPEYVSEPTFRWRSIGSNRIEITHRGMSRFITYEFRDAKNEYGIDELRMFETGKSPDRYGDIGFWISPFSLVFRDDAPGGKKIRPIVGRLWSVFKPEKRG